MKNLGKFAALGAVLALSASSAFAATISAGQAVAVGTTSSGSYTGGTLLAQTSAETFNNPAPDYNATVVASVYQGGSGATCLTCLDFVYTITDNSGSSLEHTTIYNFAGFTSNIFFVSGPNNGTATDNLSGSTITFDLAGTNNTAGLAPGQSVTFVDFTNATSYSFTGNVGAQNGISSNAPGYSPITPEPNSLMLMGTGLVSGAGMLLRRRRVNA